MGKKQLVNTAERGDPAMGEFVALMAFATSLVALSIDAMLPAFPDMALDLGVAQANDIQLVIALLFIGLSIGQLFYGPVSDSIGRKPAIYLGFALFILGSILCMLATSFQMMLAGRFLQGLGAAGPRTVCMALIRDRYKGAEMARVMSFIMTVFILVPIFAPALGQAILWFANWRFIFSTFVLLAVLTAAWLGLRQAETLPRQYRRPFTMRAVIAAFREVLGSAMAMTYTVVAGFVFGAFLGYLKSSQQIFQSLYGLGAQFPFYFAILAVAVGLASLSNSAMVMRFGMHTLANGALRILTGLSWLFLALVWNNEGQPALWAFMTAFMVMFFFLGILFGNINSIAMEPLGHVAGTGAAAVGSISTLIGVALGYFIGHAFDGTLYPMAMGFAGLTTASVLLTMLPGNRE
jgi:DHA1 family bicyclomycin/chloramphenicol resistance-like MFS transporter